MLRAPVCGLGGSPLITVGSGRSDCSLQCRAAQVLSYTALQVRLVRGSVIGTMQVQRP